MISTVITGMSIENGSVSTEKAKKFLVSYYFIILLHLLIHFNYVDRTCEPAHPTLLAISASDLVSLFSKDSG